MPKRSAAAKAQTHGEILQHAAEAFRKNGSAVGIGSLMQDLGLTHGGFYRHFESKDALFLEAVSLALIEIANRLASIAEAAGPGNELPAIIHAYLSPDHLQHPETWCALAALAPDIARYPPDLRQRLQSAMQHYMMTMSKYMPGETPQQKQQTFLLLFSGMAGAIAMIRILPDPATQNSILEMTRNYYTAAFTGTRNM